jgi:hypothetical protein
MLNTFLLSRYYKTQMFHIVILTYIFVHINLNTFDLNNFLLYYLLTKKYVIIIIICTYEYVSNLNNNFMINLFCCTEFIIHLIYKRITGFSSTL